MEITLPALNAAREVRLYAVVVCFNIPAFAAARFGAGGLHGPSLYIISDFFVVQTCWQQKLNNNWNISDDITREEAGRGRGVLRRLTQKKTV